jgi:hypothetical protein
MMLRQCSARRQIDVRISLIDSESSVHKYRIAWDDPRLSQRSKIIEFTPGNTVPLKALLALVPRHVKIHKLTVIAPSKRLPTGAKELLRTVVVWCLQTINCPVRILSSSATKGLDLECESLPPAQAFKTGRVINLSIRMTHLQYWPVQLTPVLKRFVYFEVIAKTGNVYRDELTLLYYLDQLVKCGLASSSSTPWSIFLTRGLYDPRLLLHITAFLLPPT